MKKENIYIDLSKCSEEQIISISKIIRKQPYYEKIFFLPDFEDKPFLFYMYGRWDLESHKRTDRPPYCKNSVICSKNYKKIKL